jgi:hypothetical protein
MNPHRYLEPSPARADGGHHVGRLPGTIELRELRDLGHPESPTRAIRAKCIDCSGGSDTEARKCVAVGCPLWPFRMGSNPFRPVSDAQLASVARARAVKAAVLSLQLLSGQGENEKCGEPGTDPHADTGGAEPSGLEGKS